MPPLTRVLRALIVYKRWGGAISVTRAAGTFLRRYLDALLGAVLVFAGALKAQQLLTDPSAGLASGFPRELLIAASAFELAFGCWMLLGLHRRLTRWLTIVWFTILAIEGEFDLLVRIRIDCPSSAQSSVKGHPAYVSAGFLIIFPDSPLYESPRYESVCDRLDNGVMQQRIGIDDFRIGIDFPGKLRRLVQPQIEKESRKGIGEDGCVLEKGWVYDLTARENGGPIIGRNRFQQISLSIFDRGWRA